MKPFSTPSFAQFLREHYPSAEAVRGAAEGMNQYDRLCVARLWLSEGIPFAFQFNPMLYEELRSWLAERLRVHPKQLTLVGSARIGYSLKQKPAYGRPFGNHSDLDFAAISDDLFERVVKAFHQWGTDFETGYVRPRNRREEKMWNSNYTIVPRSIQEGLIDPDKIPTFDRYPIAQVFQQAIFLMMEKLKRTEGVPAIARASIRVYRDWECFIGHCALNFLYCLKGTLTDSLER